MLKQKITDSLESAPLLHRTVMNVNDEAEVDRIFAEADIVVPDSSPGLLGAVRPSTIDAVRAEGMAPREGSNGGVRIGWDSCQGPPPSVSCVVSVCHFHTRRLFKEGVHSRKYSTFYTAFIYEIIKLYRMLLLL